MKKTYIAPNMKMVKIQPVKMIAASDPRVLSTTLGAGSAESRRNSFWDDEDDWDE